MWMRLYILMRHLIIFKCWYSYPVEERHGRVWESETGREGLTLVSSSFCHSRRETGEDGSSGGR